MRSPYLLHPGALRRVLPAALLLLAAACGGDGGTSASQKPVVNEVNPTSVVMWEDDFVLTVTGSGFVSGSVVRWNGSSRPTLYLSSTQLSAGITTADLQQSGSVQVSVLNPGNGGESNAMELVVRNPRPDLLWTNPSDALAGTGPLTLEVIGGPFAPGTVLRWNGSDRPTTVLDPGRLSVRIPGSDVAVAGTAQLTLVTPAPGGGVSNVVEFVVRPRPNPIPFAITLSPATVMAEQGGTFTITGNNFLASSTVVLVSPVTPGNPVILRVPVTLVSPTELRFTLEPGHRLTGVTPVQVANPEPGGGGSSVLSLTVMNPAPTITSISPTEAFTRPGTGDSLVVRVTGTGIVGSTVLRLDDQIRPTRRISATVVEAAMPAHELRVAHQIKVELWNPTPGGGASAPFSLRLVNPPVVAPARQR